jgi:hypothetical protein
MILATFIPKGSFSFNPKSLYGETLQGGASQEKLVEEEKQMEIDERVGEKKLTET